MSVKSVINCRHYDGANESPCWRGGNFGIFILISKIESGGCRHPNISTH